MMTIKHGIGAIILLISLMFYPQSASSNTFKSADFLTWKRENQESYIRTTVGTAGLIAVKNDKEQQRCLEDWYVSDENAANESILGAMERFPTYHPRGVIIAIMEKHCGSFNYTNR